MRVKTVSAFAGLLALCFFVQPANAMSPHSLSVGIGGVFPYTEIDTGPLGAGDQRVGDNGAVVGLRYLFASTPRIDVGGSIEFLSTGKEAYTIGTAVGEHYMNSTLLMVNAKIHPETTNNFVPYFLGGIGLHSTEFNFDLSPAPGFVWSSGNPTETRPVISDTQTGMAVSLGLGVDYNVTPNFFLAFEGRLDILSKEEYEATAYGQSIGILQAETGATNGILQVRAGFRFGKVSEDSTSNPAPDQPKTMPAKVEGAI